MSEIRKLLSPYVFPGIRPCDLPVNEFPIIFANRFKITEEEIMEIVSEECKVKISDIISSSRNREITDARHIYCASVMLRLKLTLEKIGEKLSGRDHTTIRHSLLKFMERYHHEEDYKIISDRILSKIGIKYRGQKLVRDKKVF